MHVASHTAQLELLLLLATVDNKAEPEELPLAPWS